MIYQPDTATHPGIIIQHMLDGIGMTQKNLAERTGISEKHLSQIVNGEASITADTAILLENALGGTAAFWINLDKNYKETLARIEAQKRMEAECGMVSRYPYRDLVKYGYVDATRKPRDRVANLWKFFGVNSLSFVSTTEAVAYRKQYGEGIKREALAAWLRAGEIESKDMVLPEYSEDILKRSIPALKELTISGESGFFKKAQEILRKAGVGLVCVPHFEHTQVHGACRWVGKNPLIQMTIRGRDADKFWFTLLHEVAHVLKHGKKDEFLEFNIDLKSQQEEEADNFAQKALIPTPDYSDFIAGGDFSEESIKGFAARIGVGAYIVLGRLKHDRLVGFSVLSDMHLKLKWTDSGS